MPLPSWLDVNPQAPLQAAEAGTNAGIQIGEFQQQEKQRALAQAAAAAAEHAKLDQTQKIADMDAQLTQQKIKSDFLKSMTATNAAQEYRKLQIGLQKDKLNQQVQEATQRFSQSKAREQDVHADNVAKMNETADYHQSQLQMNHAKSMVKAAADNFNQLSKTFGDNPTKDQQVQLNQAKAVYDGRQKDYESVASQFTAHPVPPNLAQGQAQPAVQASGGLPDLTGAPVPGVGAPANPMPPQGQPARPAVAPMAAPQAQAKPSQADIGYLAGHPELKDKFNARFGDGAAESILQQL